MNSGTVAFYQESIERRNPGRASPTKKYVHTHTIGGTPIVLAGPDHHAGTQFCTLTTWWILSSTCLSVLGWFKNSVTSSQVGTYLPSRYVPRRPSQDWLYVLPWLTATYVHTYPPGLYVLHWRTVHTIHYVTGCYCIAPAQIIHYHIGKLSFLVIHFTQIDPVRRSHGIQ